jgi:hypothetical protein
MRPIITVECKKSNGFSDEKNWAPAIVFAKENQKQILMRSTPDSVRSSPAGSCQKHQGPGLGDRGRA